MASLPARHVEDACAGRKREHVDQPRDLVPVTGKVEDRLVLEQVVRVEVGRPPVGRLARLAQKNTGSRYAPKTTSSAWRISYSVQ